MSTSGWVRCAVAFCLLISGYRVAYAVAGSQNVALSGESLQTVLITLPNGTQQEADTDDRKGLFWLARDRDHPGHSIAHYGFNAGDGVYTVSRKDGTLIFGAVVFGGAAHIFFPSSQVSTTAGSDSALEPDTFTGRVTVTQGGKPASGAEVWVTGLNGEAYGSGASDDKGEARFMGIRTGFYRVDILMPGAGTAPPVFRTRYQLLRGDMAGVGVDLDQPADPLGQLRSWRHYFKAQDDDKGVATAVKESRLYSAEGEEITVDYFMAHVSPGIRRLFGDIRQQWSEHTDQGYRAKLVLSWKGLLLQRHKEAVDAGFPVDEEAYKQARDLLSTWLTQLQPNTGSPGSRSASTHAASPAPASTNAPPPTPLATGRVDGRVVLDDGSAVPGVVITLRGDALDGQRTAVSTARGEYRILSLQPGHYTLTWELEGFTTIKRDVEVSSGRTVTLETTLQVATEEEDIVVTGKTGVLGDLSNPEVLRVLNMQLNLPSEQGMLDMRVWPEHNGIRFDRSAGSAGTYGDSVGGVINVITKTGGNEFQGTLDFYFKGFDDRLRAWDRISSLPPGAEEETYEAIRQGPVIKDHLWFFGAAAPTGDATGGMKPFCIGNGGDAPITGRIPSSAPRDFSIPPGKSGCVDPGTGTWSVNELPGAGEPWPLDPEVLKTLKWSFVSGGTALIPGDAGCGKDDKPVPSYSYFLNGAPTACDRQLGYQDFTAIGPDSGVTGFGLVDGPPSGPWPWDIFHVQPFDWGPPAGGNNALGGAWGTGTARSNYVNDRWQLNDRWSFNLGLRYDESTQQSDQTAANLDAVAEWLSRSHKATGNDFALPGFYGNDSGGVVIPRGHEDFQPFRVTSANDVQPGSIVVIQQGSVANQGIAWFGPEGVPALIGNALTVRFNVALEGAPPAKSLNDRLYDFSRSSWFNGPASPSESTFRPFVHTYPIDGNMMGSSMGAVIRYDLFTQAYASSDPLQDFIDSLASNQAPAALAELFPKLVEFQMPARDAAPEEPVPRFKSLPRDAFFYSSGHAKSKVDDQWGLKRLGFKASGRDGKGTLWPKKGTAVTVAMVDSGIDITHPDLQRVLWTNPGEIPGNHEDDDGNGLVDDVFGWNFVEFDNDIRDKNGHGTFVTGIIAATADNGLGIAGINPWARIMPVRVSNFHGDSNSVSAAMGISYAARMGARVINVSIAGKSTSKAEQAAIAFANSKGALVVVAAGNDGANIKDYSPAGLDGVIVAAAINSEGRRENYSNWGNVDIAAPGSDIVSLRAARTDLMQFELKDYKPGTNVIGRERLLYYASGTSFAAPYVTGVASLLLSINPKLTAAEVKRMILQSAKDIDVPGTDQFTGYGLLDAAAALKADPKFHVDAAIDGVGVVNKGGPQVRVTGTADADKFKRAWIEIGKGENPGRWKKVAQVRKAVQGGTLGDIPAAEFGGAKEWVIRLVVEHRNGRKRENRFILKLG